MASANVKPVGTEKGVTSPAIASKSTPQMKMVVFPKSSKRPHTECRFDHGDSASETGLACAVPTMEGYNILAKIVSYPVLRATTARAKQTALAFAIKDGWARLVTFEILRNVSHAITITALASPTVRANATSVGLGCLAILNVTLALMATVRWTDRVHVKMVGRLSTALGPRLLHSSSNLNSRRDQRAGRCTIIRARVSSPNQFYLAMSTTRSRSIRSN